MKPTRSKSFLFSDDFYGYVVDNWLREPEILARLREETAPMEQAGMQISPEQGQFMAMLARLMGVKRYLEVGVFTGYSSLSIALAMPEDGWIVACDVSEEFTAMAKRYWAEAGVADRINLHMGPAVDTLHSLLTGGVAPFDMMFIDADKPNYLNYYELGLKLVRPGGVILIDNVFWSGEVANEAATDENVVAIREVNSALHGDSRIELAILPIGDGLTMARVV